VVKMGIIRNIAGLKKMIKQRDLMTPLPQRKKTPQKKEVMFTWNLQVHMKIVMYG
jgi:hypothetical protein